MTVTVCYSVHVSATSLSLIVAFGKQWDCEAVLCCKKKTSRIKWEHHSVTSDWSSAHSTAMGLQWKLLALPTAPANTEKPGAEERWGKPPSNNWVHTHSPQKHVYSYLHTHSHVHLSSAISTSLIKSVSRLYQPRKIALLSLPWCSCLCLHLFIGFSFPFFLVISSLTFQNSVTFHILVQVYDSVTFLVCALIPGLCHIPYFCHFLKFCNIPEFCWAPYSCHILNFCPVP